MDRIEGLERPLSDYGHGTLSHFEPATLDPPLEEPIAFGF